MTIHKTIAFVTSGLQFNGNTINEKALGGSESALIYMAKELAALNNSVTVYCRCDRPGKYDSVEYKSLSDFMKDNQSQFDVLIVSRYTEFLSIPLDTKMNILWCHDIGVENFKEAMTVADRIFCLSDYHKGLYVDKYSITPSDYVWQTTNGYDQTIAVTLIPFTNKKNNYIYASRPERGLKLLLEKIWPEIQKKNPEAILNICGYEHNLGMPDDVAQVHKDVEFLLKYSKNVVKHGNLSKPEYYKLLANCAYMVYPTDFPEISCINAIEAQYNGCLVITSDKFALTETVKTDTRVTSEYGSPEYIRDLLQLIDQYQDELYDNTVHAAKRKIESYSWKNVAVAWNNEIDKMFQDRHTQYQSHIINQLVYNSDIVAAWKLTGDQKYRDMLDKAEQDNLTVSLVPANYTDEDGRLNERSQKVIDLVQTIVDKDPSVKLKILDLGSNDAILTLPLVKRHSANIEQIVLYDSSQAALDFVKNTFGSRYPQFEYVKDNVSNLTAYKFTPDIVLVGELLEHIENTQEFLSLLMSLAGQNTLFYFTVPGGPWESIVKNNPEINHVHHFEKRDIETIFENFNPTIVRSKHGGLGRRGEPVFNWMFWFTASHTDTFEFGQVDYQEKWLKTRPYKSISCCMIVKNEEDNLSRCLKSVTDFVDELVIVDTGSTDDTKYIARKFTDNIYDLEWAEADGLGNFSRARNYSIDQATGDYIFWIDADEQLENWPVLFKYLVSDYYDGIMLNQRQCMTYQEHGLGTNIDVMHDRIFKRGQIRFTGVIHEYPSKDGEHFLENMFWQKQASILHYGLANRQLLRAKSTTRNTELIYKNIKTHPTRVLAKHYLLGNYWSQFFNGHPNPDLSWIEAAMNLWNTELKYCNDDWVITVSLKVIQQFYSYCAYNKIGCQGKVPEKLAFQNDNGDLLEFFVLDPRTETDFFLKYLGSSTNTN